MGGGGGKGGGQAGMPPAIQNMLLRLEQQTRGARTTAAEEFSRVMRGAQPRAWAQVSQIEMPHIATMEAASRRATSQTLRETGTELARTGLAGTPFGERIMAETRQRGAEERGQIAPQMKWQAAQQRWATQMQLLHTLLGGAGPFAVGQAGAVAGAMPGMRESEQQQKSWTFGL